MNAVYNIKNDRNSKKAFLQIQKSVPLTLAGCSFQVSPFCSRFSAASGYLSQTHQDMVRYLVKVAVYS